MFRKCEVFFKLVLEYTITLYSKDLSIEVLWTKFPDSFPSIEKVKFVRLENNVLKLSERMK